MSAPRHTAGPWERLQGFAEKGHPSYAEGQYVIRIVQKREPGQTEFVKVALVDAGPVAANARLIAAAPCGLAAAEKAIALATVDEGPADQVNITGEAYRALVAFVAKATGQ